MLIALSVVAVLVLLPLLWPHRWLVREGKRYLLRWPLLGGDGLKRAPFGLGREGENLFLHLIIMSDGPAVHSHPWWARAYILLGSYRDTRQYQIGNRWSRPITREYGPGDINFIDEETFHTVNLVTPFALTLCRTGKKHGRGWAFKIGNETVSASGRGAAAYDEAHGRT